MNSVEILVWGMTLTTDLKTLGIEQIPQNDLHTEITTRLAKLITRAEPGSKLPSERELGEALNVGRNSVREAIRSLAFIGAIQVRRGDGIYVTKVGDAEIERLAGLGLLLQRSQISEVIEARQFFEVDVVTLAAQRHTDADRERLSQNLLELEKHIASASDASRLDLQFHELLARASHNSVMVFVVSGMRTLIKAWIDIKIDKATDRDRVTAEILEDHRAIFDAVARRDARVAADLMSGHLKRAGERLASIMGDDLAGTEDALALFMAKVRP